MGNGGTFSPEGISGKIMKDLAPYVGQRDLCNLWDARYHNWDFNSFKMLTQFVEGKLCHQLQ